MTFQLQFSAQGYVTQTVEILSPSLTPDSIVAGLKSGELATTVLENGTIDIVATGVVVAKIVNQDNELEYFDYEVCE